MIYYVTPGTNHLPQVSEIYPIRETENTYRVTPSIFTGMKATLRKDDEFVHTSKEAAYACARECLGSIISSLRNDLNSAVAHIKVLEEMESSPDVPEEMTI